MIDSGKITFCIQDNGPLLEDIPGKPKEKIYPGCDSEIQGISVGWFDRYLAEVSGQELNINNLEDGVYGFVTIVDPENKIIEKNEYNNFSISFIKIYGDKIEIIGE